MVITYIMAAVSIYWIDIYVFQYGILNIVLNHSRSTDVTGWLFQYTPTVLLESTDLIIP